MRTVDMSFLSHLTEAQATAEDGVSKGCATRHCSLHAPPEWACSSVVEHCVDIAGVASSILATPTIFSLSYNDLAGLIAVPIRNSSMLADCRSSGKWRCGAHEPRTVPVAARERGNRPDAAAGFHGRREDL